jgi:hypothetical protein
VGFNAVEVIVISGSLSEDFLKTLAFSVDVKHICEGFPDDIGEMVGDHEM